jgi:hypothetical protein
MQFSFEYIGLVKKILMLVGCNKMKNLELGWPAVELNSKAVKMTETQGQFLATN